jgi:methionine-rich copper-binding protein CopC
MRAIMLSLLLLAPASAWAHAFLKEASPAVGSTIATAPSTISLDFTEGVEPGFCTVTVQDAAGARVDKGDLHGSGTHLEIGVGALPPGRYKVTWHATAVDTHKTQGSFTFTVQS